MCIACTTTKKIIFTWKKIPWSLLPNRILEPLQNTVLTKQERCEILWIFWILWINHMDQITWIKLSGSNYLDQIVWIKLSGSNCLDQIIWIKLHGSNYLGTLNQNIQIILQGIKPQSSKYWKYSIIFARNQTSKLKILKIPHNFCKESNLKSKYLNNFAWSQTSKLKILTI